jgi:hypothetical protein
VAIVSRTGGPPPFLNVPFQPTAIPTEVRVRVKVRVRGWVRVR